MTCSSTVTVSIGILPGANRTAEFPGCAVSQLTTSVDGSLLRWLSQTRVIAPVDGPAVARRRIVPSNTGSIRVINGIPGHGGVARQINGLPTRRRRRLSGLI